jgi:hypothetical protein
MRFEGYGEIEIVRLYVLLFLRRKKQKVMRVEQMGVEMEPG